MMPRYVRKGAEGVYPMEMNEDDTNKKVLLEAQVRISKKDRQVAEFYLRLRKAWEAKNELAIGLLGANKDSKNQKDETEKNEEAVRKTDLTLSPSIPNQNSISTILEFQIPPTTHSLRYIPNGRCRRIAAIGCDIVGLSPCKGVRKPTVSHPANSPSLLGSLVSQNELPDLGTGVVDELTDLVPDPVTLVEDDFLTANLTSHLLSAEALLEFGCEPERGVPVDQIWGFSDSDPNDWLYTEERDILDECVEIVGRIKRLQTRKPKITKIKYGLSKVCVLTEDLTESTAPLPAVNQTTLIPAVVPPVVQELPLTEEQWEGVSLLPPVATSAVEHVKYIRDADLHKHETTPQMVTGYDIALVPAISIVLSGEVEEIPNDSYGPIGCALYNRLHYQIAEVTVAAVEVEQHYVFRDFSVPLVDIALTHPQFLPLYTPKNNKLTPKNNKPLRHWHIASQQQDAVKVNGDVISKRQRGRPRKTTSGTEVANASVLTSNRKKSDPTTKHTYFTKRRRKEKALDAEMVNDQELLSKFEKGTTKSKNTQDIPNAFECSNLDSLLGSLAVSNEPPSSPSILKDNDLSCGGALSDADNGDENWCISHVHSVNNPIKAADNSPVSQTSASSISPKAEEIEIIKNDDSSVQAPVAPRKSKKQQNRLPPKLRSLIKHHVRVMPYGRTCGEVKSAQSTSKQIESAYNIVTAYIRDGRADSLELLNDPLFEFLTAIGIEDGETFPDALNRGGNLIQAQQRLFVMLLIEMMIMNEERSKHQSRLNQLRVDLGINSENDFQRLTASSVVEPFSNVASPMSPCHNGLKMDVKSLDPHVAKAEFRKVSADFKETIHLADVCSHMHEVGVVASEMTAPKKSCGNIVSSSQAKRLVEGNVKTDVSYSTIGKCDGDKVENCKAVVDQLLSDMTGAIEKISAGMPSNLGIDNVELDNSPNEKCLQKMGNHIIREEVKHVLNSIIAQISTSDRSSETEIAAKEERINKALLRLKQNSTTSGETGSIMQQSRDFVNVEAERSGIDLSQSDARKQTISGYHDLVVVPSSPTQRLEDKNVNFEKWGNSVDSETGHVLDGTVSKVSDVPAEVPTLIQTELPTNLQSLANCDREVQKLLFEMTDAVVQSISVSKSMDGLCHQMNTSSSMSEADPEMSNTITTQSNNHRDTALPVNAKTSPSVFTAIATSQRPITNFFDPMCVESGSLLRTDNAMNRKELIIGDTVATLEGVVTIKDEKTPCDNLSNSKQLKTEIDKVSRNAEPTPGESRKIISAQLCSEQEVNEGKQVLDAIVPKTLASTEISYGAQEPQMIESNSQVKQPFCDDDVKRLMSELTSAIAKHVLAVESEKEILNDVNIEQTVQKVVSELIDSVCKKVDISSLSVKCDHELIRFKSSAASQNLETSSLSNSGKPQILHGLSGNMKRHHMFATPKKENIKAYTEILSLQLHSKVTLTVDSDFHNDMDVFNCEPATTTSQIASTDEVICSKLYVDQNIKNEEPCITTAISSPGLVNQSWSSDCDDGVDEEWYEQKLCTADQSVSLRDCSLKKVKCAKMTSGPTRNNTYGLGNDDTSIIECMVTDEHMFDLQYISSVGNDPASSGLAVPDKNKPPAESCEHDIGMFPQPREVVNLKNRRMERDDAVCSILPSSNICDTNQVEVFHTFKNGQAVEPSQVESFTFGQCGDQESCLEKFACTLSASSSTATYKPVTDSIEQPAEKQYHIAVENGSTVPAEIKEQGPLEPKSVHNHDDRLELGKNVLCMVGHPTDGFDDFDQVMITASYSLQCREDKLVQCREDKLPSADGQVCFSSVNSNQGVVNKLTKQDLHFQCCTHPIIDDVAFSLGLHRVKEHIPLPVGSGCEKVVVLTKSHETMKLDVLPEVQQLMIGLVDSIEDFLEMDTVVKSVVNHILFAVTTCKNDSAAVNNSLWDIYNQSHFRSLCDHYSNSWPKVVSSKPHVKFEPSTFSISSENQSLIKTMKLFSTSNMNSLRSVLQNICLPSKEASSTVAHQVTIEKMEQLAETLTLEQASKLKWLLHRVVNNLLAKNAPLLTTSPDKEQPCTKTESNLATHPSKLKEDGPELLSFAHFKMDLDAIEPTRMEPTHEMEDVSVLCSDDDIASDTDDESSTHMDTNSQKLEQTQDANNTLSHAHKERLRRKGLMALFNDMGKTIVSNADLLRGTKFSRVSLLIMAKCAIERLKKSLPDLIKEHKQLRAKRTALLQRLATLVANERISLDARNKACVVVGLPNRRKSFSIDDRASFADQKLVETSTQPQPLDHPYSITHRSDHGEKNQLCDSENHLALLPTTAQKSKDASTHSITSDSSRVTTTSSKLPTKVTSFSTRSPVSISNSLPGVTVKTFSAASSPPTSATRAVLTANSTLAASLKQHSTANSSPPDDNVTTASTTGFQQANATVRPIITSSSKPAAAIVRVVSTTSSLEPTARSCSSRSVILVSIPKVKRASHYGNSVLTSVTNSNQPNQPTVFKVGNIDDKSSFNAGRLVLTRNTSQPFLPKTMKSLLPISSDSWPKTSIATKLAVVTSSLKAANASQTFTNTLNNALLSSQSNTKYSASVKQSSFCTSSENSKTVVHFTQKTVGNLPATSVSASVPTSKLSAAFKFTAGQLATLTADLQSAPLHIPHSLNNNAATPKSLDHFTPNIGRVLATSVGVNKNDKSHSVVTNTICNILQYPTTSAGLDKKFISSLPLSNPIESVVDECASSPIDMQTSTSLSNVSEKMDHNRTKYNFSEVLGSMLTKIPKVVIEDSYRMSPSIAPAPSIYDLRERKDSSKTKPIESSMGDYLPTTSITTFRSPIKSAETNNGNGSFNKGSLQSKSVPTSLAALRVLKCKKLSHLPTQTHQHNLPFDNVIRLTDSPIISDNDLHFKRNKLQSGRTSAVQVKHTALRPMGWKLIKSVDHQKLFSDHAPSSTDCIESYKFFSNNVESAEEISHSRCTVTAKIEHTSEGPVNKEPIIESVVHQELVSDNKSSTYCAPHIGKTDDVDSEQSGVSIGEIATTANCGNSITVSDGCSQDKICTILPSVNSSSPEMPSRLTQKFCRKRKLINSRSSSVKQRKLHTDDVVRHKLQEKIYEVGSEQRTFSGYNVPTRVLLTPLFEVSGNGRALRIPVSKPFTGVQNSFRILEQKNNDENSSQEIVDDTVACKPSISRNASGADKDVIPKCEPTTNAQQNKRKLGDYNGESSVQKSVSSAHSKHSRDPDDVVQHVMEDMLFTVEYLSDANISVDDDTNQSIDRTKQFNRAPSSARKSNKNISSDSRSSSPASSKVLVTDKNGSADIKPPPSKDIEVVCLSDSESDEDIIVL